MLARLRSTAGTNLVPQSAGLARSSSSLSGDLQLSPSGSGTVPSISRLGSIAAGPPQLNKLAPAVGLGAARRSADLPLQQLMGMQTPGAHTLPHSPHPQTPTCPPPPPPTPCCTGSQKACFCAATGNADSRCGVPCFDCLSCLACHAMQCLLLMKIKMRIQMAKPTCALVLCNATSKLNGRPEKVQQEVQDFGKAALALHANRLLWLLIHASCCCEPFAQAKTNASHQNGCWSGSSRLVSYA